MAIATAPRAKTGGPRHRIEVERHEIVGAFMDAGSLVSEAMYANGAALQLLRRLPAGAAVEQALIATHDTSTRLSKAAAVLREWSGRYDKPERA